MWLLPASDATLELASATQPSRVTSRAFLQSPAPLLECAASRTGGGGKVKITAFGVKLPPTLSALDLTLEAAPFREGVLPPYAICDLCSGHWRHLDSGSTPSTCHQHQSTTTQDHHPQAVGHSEHDNPFHRFFITIHPTPNTPRSPPPAQRTHDPSPFNTLCSSRYCLVIVFSTCPIVY